jgi:hypothetical protein
MEYYGFMHTKNHEKVTQALPAVVYKPYAPQEVGEGGMGSTGVYSQASQAEKALLGISPEKLPPQAPLKPPSANRQASRAGTWDIPTCRYHHRPQQRREAGPEGGGDAPGAPQEWAGPSLPLSSSLPNYRVI